MTGKRDPTVRRQWMRFGVRQFDALLQRFAAVDELPFRPPIWLRSVEITADCRLRSHGAIHFATADDGFLKVFDLEGRLIREPLA